MTTDPRILSDERLQEIRQREQAATEGPWKTIKPGHGQKSKYLCVQFGRDERYASLEQLPCDANFVAASRSDIPALLSHIDALTEERDRLKLHINSTEDPASS